MGVCERAKMPVLSSCCHELHITIKRQKLTIMLVLIIVESSRTKASNECASVETRTRLGGFFARVEEGERVAAGSNDSTNLLHQLGIGYCNRSSPTARRQSTCSHPKSTEVARSCLKPVRSHTMYAETNAVAHAVSNFIV